MLSVLQIVQTSSGSLMSWNSKRLNHRNTRCTELSGKHAKGEVHLTHTTLMSYTDLLIQSWSMAGYAPGYLRCMENMLQFNAWTRIRFVELRAAAAADAASSHTFRKWEQAQLKHTRSLWLFWGIEAYLIFDGCIVTFSWYACHLSSTAD